MSTPSLAALQFGALLGESMGKLESFVQLLEREQALLVGGKVDELIALAEDKSAAVRELQKGENARSLVLARAGVSNARESVTAFVQAQSDGLRQAWEKFTTLAAKADELNRINGGLIRQQMQSNQQAMAVLLSASGQTLYGANGQTAAKPSGRLFGSV